MTFVHAIGEVADCRCDLVTRCAGEVRFDTKGDLTVNALARWCVRRRFLVIGLWLVALLGLGAAQSSAGAAYHDNVTIPGSESTTALALLEQAFPNQAGEIDTVVWRGDPQSVRMTEALAKIAQVEHVTRVERAQQVSNGITYATVTFDALGSDLSKDAVKQVIDIAHAARAPGLDVAVGGPAVGEVTQEAGHSVLYGLIAAAVILLLAFGSILGMLLPIVVAAVALGCGLLVAGFAGHLVDIATSAPILGTLIGLGVGIDYALFIVTRHRNGLKTGLSTGESIVTAVTTSGRAVVFAGGTVCVALLGLLVLDVSFLAGLAISSAIVVVMTVATSVTLLPALLAVVGKRVMGRRKDGAWNRWAAFTERRPKALAVTAAIVMVALAVPILSLRLGFADQGTQPPSSTARKAYDMLADGFGPGINGPLQVVAQPPHGLDRVATVEGIAHVGPVVLSPDGSIGVVQVIPTTSPQDEATSELITRLRAVLPDNVHVGGMTALNDDFTGLLAGKLPLFLAIIVLLGGLLLMFAFRSLLIPLTAAVMNLLAAAATFGVVVAVFQWGWGADLLDVGTGPIEAFTPVLLLSILFGLSMDYQVFLVSRMHEEWIRTKDNSRAVTVGVADTSRVITAAAAIMIFVFGSFVLGGQRFVAEIGLGLAVAIALDAFVLRTMLVPALMHMFGRANWWMPRWHSTSKI